MKNVNIEEGIPQEEWYLSEIRKKIQQEEQWRHKYGNIKPIITAEGSRERIVGVKNTVYFSPKWKTFPDFLFEYIWMVFGKEWIESQKKVNENEIHTAILWHRAFKKLVRKHSEGKTGIIESPLNGQVAALLCLAYDLFTIEHNLYLPQKLLARLRNRDQFQGARYELFCVCALLRAGFSVEFQNESDGSTTHPEFIATHLATGIKVAVEAKSKHRAGILGASGEKLPDNKIRLGKIRQLLNDAILKEANHPLIIFVDVNLPPQKADKVLYHSLTQKMSPIVESLPQTGDSLDKFNFVFFTNHPHHYGREDEPNPARIYSAIISLKPRHPLNDARIFDDIMEGACKYGHVPQSFDTEPQWLKIQKY